MFKARVKGDYSGLMLLLVSKINMQWDGMHVRGQVN